MDMDLEKPARRPPPSANPGWGRTEVIRNATVFIAVVLAGFVVKALQEIITPLVVAVFLLLLIDAFSLGVERRWPRCPEWLRLSLAAGLIVIGFAAIVGVCAHYGRDFAAEIAGLEPKLNGLLGRVSGALQFPALTLPDLARGENPSTVLFRVFGAARGIVSRAVLVVIYLGFLLASRRAFGRKTQRLFPEPGRHAHALRLFQRVRGATEEYMAIQTLKAALIAVLASAVTAAVGLPNAPFWAFLLFLAAYIPIVGGIAGALVPTLVAMAEFDTPLRPAILLVLLGGGIFLIDNVVMPKIQADRLNIDPVFVLLSLGFWGVMFGLPGVFLSTPLTVMVIAVTAEVPGLRWLAVLLSKEGELHGDLAAPPDRP
ncbi:MAG TPA: AI-2E family transporter [Caulobacteraceae bacterium]|jgi:predicted PurR-regulated permease PerM|nr:AI-2E family transporter [Caulobacteraceae bacterium]